MKFCQGDGGNRHSERSFPDRIWMGGWSALEIPANDLLPLAEFWQIVAALLDLIATIVTPSEMTISLGEKLFGTERAHFT